MVFQHWIVVIPLVFLVNKAFCQSLVPEVERKNGKNVAFTSPVALYKINYYRKRCGTKQIVEMGGNKTASKVEGENKIKENSTKFQSKLSITEDFIFGSELLLLGTISFLGNSCTFVLFYSQKKQLSPVEILIVHLAILDVLLTFATYPLPIISAFTHGWYFGQLGCTFQAFICEFLTASSVFSITFVAVFRCLKTCLISPGVQVTCGTAYKVLTWGNLISFLWTTTPLFGVGKYDAELIGLECAVNWIAGDAASQLRQVLETVFGVFLPLVIILVCYFHIIKTVNRSTAQLQSSPFCRRKPKITASQLIFIGILVTFGFAITRIPITITTLLCSFRGELVISNWTTAILVLLAKSSAALNPFIYVFSTKRYRKRLSRMLYLWIYCRAGKGTQKWATFNRRDFTKDLKSTSERDANGKIEMEICINSLGMHEFYPGLRRFE